jgi:hypothetical protein
MEIMIPENIIDSIDKKEDLIQKIIWHTKNNYEKYDGVFRKLHQPTSSPAAPHPGQALLGTSENLINKIVEKTFNILHDASLFPKLHTPVEIMQNLPISSENILSISELNNLVVLNTAGPRRACSDADPLDLPNVVGTTNERMILNRCYTQSYYDNKIIYDTIILYIYSNLFKAHGFIDDVKIFLEKFNYFKKEQSCWWKDSLCKQNGNENILEEAPLLLNYYNLFLHAKNLLENPTLKYTLDLVSNILENKIYVSGSGRKISTECRIMLCRYVCNIELIPRNNNYRKKVKKVKSKKSLSKLIIPNNDTSKKILNRFPSGVFRKLQQPSVSPAAPHPEQTLLGSAENSVNHYDLRKTNIFPKFCGVFRNLHQAAASPSASHLKQTLLGDAEKIKNHNFSFNQYISLEQSGMPQNLVKTIFGFITYHDFDFMEKNIFNHMYGPVYDSFHI